MPDNRLKIKVCGMRNSENIRALATLRPDFIGFIFYEKSPRYVLNISPPAPPEGGGQSLSFEEVGEARKVGVFVNESVENILALAKRYQLDFVQLHGNETPLQCLNLMNADLGVIKAFSIAESADFAQTEAYEGCADYFLFDTKAPPAPQREESLRGGTGQKFDWSVLNDYQGNTPFLLSGGIDENDAEEILKINHPLLFGVDINSKFEKEAGVKDIEKVRTFFTKMSKK